MKGIKCTQSKFNALNLKVFDYLENKVSGFKAERWCNPVIHPTTGDIVFTVEDRILPALTQSERDSVFELTDDWFKDEI